MLSISNTSSRLILVHYLNSKAKLHQSRPLICSVFASQDILLIYLILKNCLTVALTELIMFLPLETGRIAYLLRPLGFDVLLSLCLPYRSSCSELTPVILQKNLLFRKGIGIQNFSGPSSYSCKRNRNYSFTLIPLKGKEYQHLPEF